MPFLRPTSRAVRLPLVLAMLALVLAQALGGWHRIRHGVDTGSHVGSHAGSHSDASAPAASGSPGSPASPALGHAHHAHGHDPYAHEAGSDTCRLLDALTQAGVPPATPCVLPPSTAAAVSVQGARSIVVAAATPFDARGPPAAH